MAQVKSPRGAGPLFFLVAMAVYLLAVHAVGFGAPRLPGLPFDGTSWFFASGQAGGLNPSPLAFAGQLAWLYACMVCVFFLTKFVVRGPWWYGSLTAVLLMAHPLKTDAILGAGSPWLQIAFFNLLALTLFTGWRAAPSRGRALAAIGAMVLAVAADPRSAALLPILFFYAQLDESRPIRRRVLAGAMLLSFAACYAWVVLRTGATPSLAGAGLDLLLVLYPIGLLPETALRFEAFPVLLYGTLGAAVLFLVWVLWLSRARAILWAIGAALIWRLLQGAPLEPVYLEGGGRMIVEIALVAIAFAALCHRAAQHPKWSRHIVTLTTLLCLVFFVLQFRAVQSWREAATWRAAYLQAAGDTPPVVDWIRYDAIPLRLADTPAPPLNFWPGLEATLSASGELAISGERAERLLYPEWPALSFSKKLRAKWRGVRRGDATILETKAEGVTLELNALPEDARLILP